jgi:hypothetical protein
MISKWWVYTNSGIKVGEFAFEAIENEDANYQMAQKTLYLWCIKEGLDPAAHNMCGAAK